MPKFKVEMTSKLAKSEAYQRVKMLLETDKDLKKMDPSCVFNFNDLSHTGNAKGSMFSAALNVTGDDSLATVSIEIDLPLMLTPVKGMVQSTLEKKLTATLG